MTAHQFVRGSAARVAAECGEFAEGVGGRNGRCAETWLRSEKSD